MAYNQRARKELVYSEFSVINSSSPFPINFGYLHSTFAKYAAFIYKPNTVGGSEGYSWDEFMKHCLLDITTFTGNTQQVERRFPPQRFETDTAFINFLNGRIPNNGSRFLVDVQIKIYNVVDGSVPTVNKIYGFNHFYHSLNNGDSLNKNPHLLDARFPNNKDFVTGAWKSVWGVDVDSTNYDDNKTEWDSTIWFQSRKLKNLYNLPAVNVGMGVENGSSCASRYAYDESLASLVQMTEANGMLGSVFRFVTSKVARIAQSVGYTGYDNVPDPQSDIQYPYPYSFVILYGVMFGDKKAIYIKPFGGIDNYCVPKFDSTQFRLEAVYSSPQHKDRYKYISFAEGQGHQTYTNRIPRDTLFYGGNSRSGGRRVINNDSAWDVRFYLRRLNSDYVGAIGKQYIKALHGYNKWCPLTFLIHQDTP